MNIDSLHTLSGWTKSTNLVPSGRANQRHEAGDLIQAGVDWTRTHESLTHIGRRPQADGCVFKSLDYANSDLAAARVALQLRHNTQGAGVGRTARFELATPPVPAAMATTLRHVPTSDPFRRNQLPAHELPIALLVPEGTRENYDRTAPWILWRIDSAGNVHRPRFRPQCRTARSSAQSPSQGT